MTPENTFESGRANVNRVHIERGAVAMGTDGPLGTIEQIVMDGNTGELRALVIGGGQSGMSEVAIAATHVVPGATVGHQVNLDIGMADIRAHPELALPYDPKQYVPVHEDLVLPSSEARSAATFSERPVVTEIRGNAAEVMVPGPSSTHLAQEGSIADDDLDASTDDDLDAATTETALTPDEQPTIVLRAQRSLTAREQELDTPAPAVDVEPTIAPDEVAATAAISSLQANSPAVAGQMTDEIPADVTNAAPSPDLGTSSAEPEVGDADDDVWTAEASTPDSGEERHEENSFVSEQQFSEVLEVDVPADGEAVVAEGGAFMSDVESSEMRNFRPMGNSVWVAVPSAEESEPWQQPDYRWRSYNFDFGRRSGNRGVVMGAVLGLIAAVGTVLLVRRASKRRASRLRVKTATAGQTARELARTAQRQAVAAKEAVPAALESAADTARRMRRTVSDLPGRWRWFRRGVRVGTAVAVPIAQAQLSRRKQAQDTAARQAAKVAQ